MLEHMIETLNTTLPFIFLALLGMFMKRRKMIGDNFIAMGNKAVFYFAIPVTIFNTIRRADLSAVFDAWFLTFNSLFLVAFFLVTWFLTNTFMKDKKSVPAFVNSAYRSSLSVVAPPLFALMFRYSTDVSIYPKAILMVSVLLILSYATASVMFAVHDPNARKKGVLGIVVSIAKNPVVIGVVAGLVCNFLGLSVLPVFAERTTSSLAGLVMPLAMICVGGSLSFSGFNAKFKYSVIAAVVKLLIMPVTAFVVAYLFGFRGSDLTIIMLLNALPMAVGAYVMQAELGGDTYIGATTLTFTMALSAFTLTLFIFLFRVMGFLA